MLTLREHHGECEALAVNYSPTAGYVCVVCEQQVRWEDGLMCWRGEAMSWCVTVHKRCTKGWTNEAMGMLVQLTEGHL